MSAKVPCSLFHLVAHSVISLTGFLFPILFCKALARYCLKWVSARGVAGSQIPWALIHGIDLLLATAAWTQLLGPWGWESLPQPRICQVLAWLGEMRAGRPEKGHQDFPVEKLLWLFLKSPVDGWGFGELDSRVQTGAEWSNSFFWAPKTNLEMDQVRF